MLVQQQADKEFPNWADCKNMLCIRADNIGDVLMSSPAISALKQSFGCRITVLTSSMGSPIADCLDCIDEVIVFDFPWVKKQAHGPATDLFEITSLLRDKKFDAAVIFTVYSQNPLPAAMIAYMAGIPRTLAYCRENPYELISHWCPDKEPYQEIFHQVKRDLNLVRRVGANVSSDHLKINIPLACKISLLTTLSQTGINTERPWVILHAGVSEEKRRYPEADWIELGRQLSENSMQIVLTGSPSEKSLAERLAVGIGYNAYSLAGQLSLGEFAALVEMCPLVISVNTATVHIAAATSTPVIVLYALTNPQHLPWKARGAFFLFAVPEELQSRNEVIRHVQSTLTTIPKTAIRPIDIVTAALQILNNPSRTELMPEVIV